MEPQPAQPTPKQNLLDKNVPNPLAKNPKFYTHKVFATVGLILIGTIVVLAVLWIFTQENYRYVTKTQYSAPEKEATKSAEPITPNEATASSSENTNNSPKEDVVGEFKDSNGLEKELVFYMEKPDAFRTGKYFIVLKGNPGNYGTQIKLTDEVFSAYQADVKISSGPGKIYLYIFHQAGDYGEGALIDENGKIINEHMKTEETNAISNYAGEKCYCGLPYFESWGNSDTFTLKIGTSNLGNFRVTIRTTDGKVVSVKKISD